jgi:hypothetical protein
MHKLVKKIKLPSEKMNAILKNVKVCHVMIIMTKMIANIIKEAFINPKNLTLNIYKNSKSQIYLIKTNLIEK